MSDSEEIVSSDQESQSEEEEICTSDDSGEGNQIVSGQPSRDLTIDDSDVSDDDDERIGSRRNRVVGRKKRPAVIDSESEADEEDYDEMEDRALSPRTRMSITGIRPNDLSDESSEIEYSEEEDNIVHTVGHTKSKPKLSNISEAYDSVEDSKNTEKSVESNVEHESPDRYSARNSLLEESAEEKSNMHSSSMVSAQSEVDESSNASIKNNKSMSPTKPNNANCSIINSPALQARYSTHFEEAIKDKLSSTVYRPPEINSSADSDIQIIERKEKPIEILSSDDDKENNLSASFQSKSTPKASIVTTENMIQPKILAALSKVTNLNKLNTPSAKSKSEVKYVSQEFYDKEIKKFEELKADRLNAEKLLEKISKSLPDGGRQLSLRIERLRNDCAIKSEYIASLRVEDAPGTLPHFDPVNEKDSPSQKLQQLQEERKALFNNKAPDWDELSNAVNQIQPKYTGKQGMATFNTQKVLTVDRLKVSLIFV